MKDLGETVAREEIILWRTNGTWWHAERHQLRAEEDDEEEESSFGDRQLTNNWQ